jgi:hypothetical protein
MLQHLQFGTYFDYLNFSNCTLTSYSFFCCTLALIEGSELNEILIRMSLRWLLSEMRKGDEILLSERSRWFTY